MFIADTNLGDVLVGIVVEQTLNVPPPKNEVVVPTPLQLYVV